MEIYDILQRDGFHNHKRLSTSFGLLEKIARFKGHLADGFSNSKVLGLLEMIA